MAMTYPDQESQSAALYQPREPGARGREHPPHHVLLAVS